MKTAILLFSSLCLLTFTSCNLFGPKDHSDDYKLGLKLASKERLRAIPMASTPFSGASLPPVVDLSANLPPIGNQGRQSSCVAWSVGYGLKAYEEKVETKQTILFSPSYIYNQLNNGQDGGIYIIDALNLVSQEGAGLLDDMPYNDKDFTSRPTKTASDNAAKFKIDFWRQVNVVDIKEVKAQLNAGFPVIIGTALDEGFINDGSKMKTAFIWKSPVGSAKGGHAMLVVGYNDTKKAFKVMNSWGSDWGDNGFAWIDYSYFPNVVKEGYVAKDAADSIPEVIDDSKKTVIVENEKPTNSLAVKFDNISVLHNQPDPAGIDGMGMIISGRADIPAGYGKNFQIAIYINDDAGTTPIKTLMPDRYTDPSGNVATATTIMEIPQQGIFDYHFKAYLPYSTLDIPLGHYVNGQYQTVTTNMLAKPILFIDNYAVGFGEQHKFYVKR